MKLEPGRKYLSLCTFAIHKAASDFQLAFAALRASNSGGNDTLAREKGKEYDDSRVGHLVENAVFVVSDTAVVPFKENGFALHCALITTDDITGWIITGDNDNDGREERKFRIV